VPHRHGGTEHETYERWDSSDKRHRAEYRCERRDLKQAANYP
jgi:hypothetical protein